MENIFHEEKLGLIEKCPRCEERFEPPSRKRRHGRYWAIVLTVNVVLLIAFVLAFNSNTWQKTSSGHRSEAPLINHDEHLVGSPSSPLNGHEPWHMESRPHGDWDNQLFFGEPSYESDWAWINLTRARLFRLHPDEKARLNITDSVRIHPGDDFGSILGVMHNLHCLRRIRQMLYPDYYYPDAPEDLMEHNVKHAVHCLEALRTSVLCYPDLNPHPYFWTDDKYHGIAVSSKVTRKCVNWDAFLDLVEPRDSEPTGLMRDTGPEYGKLYSHYHTDSQS